MGALDHPAVRGAAVDKIADPVAVCQLTGPGHEGWDSLKQSYEQALAHFENKEFRAAARILGGLLAQPLHRDDGPAYETANGSKVWYRNGELHRDDGPAAEYSDGRKEWYHDGRPLTPQVRGISEKFHLDRELERSDTRAQAKP